MISDVQNVNQDSGYFPIIHVRQEKLKDAISMLLMDTVNIVKNLPIMNILVFVSLLAALD